jgi:hypothetical protein
VRIHTTLLLASAAFMCLGIQYDKNSKSQYGFDMQQSANPFWHSEAIWLALKTKNIVETLQLN